MGQLSGNSNLATESLKDVSSKTFDWKCGQLLPHLFSFFIGINKCMRSWVQLMEYSYLLDLADDCQDPSLKLVYACETDFTACRLWFHWFFLPLLSVSNFITSGVDQRANALFQTMKLVVGPGIVEFKFWEQWSQLLCPLEHLNWYLSSYLSSIMGHFCLLRIATDVETVQSNSRRDLRDGQPQWHNMAFGTGDSFASKTIHPPALIKISFLNLKSIPTERFFML